MALELQHCGALELIYPIIVGEVQPLGTLSDGYGNFFADDAKANCPRVVVQAVEDKLAENRRRGGKGSAHTAPQTVDGVLDEVLAHQGVALSGARHDAVEHVVEEVVRMVGRVGKGE